MWSPDGTKIAFSSDRNGISYDIYLMRPDGSGVTPITNSLGTDASPKWRP